MAEIYGAPNIYPAEEAFTRRELMRRELRAAGFSVVEMGHFIIASTEDGFCWLDETESSFQSHFCQRLLADKVLTRRYMKHIGISHAVGSSYTKDEEPRARQLLGRLGQVVIKPDKGLKGRGVSVGVTLSTFDQAWKRAWKYASKRVLVESFFEGEEARYVVLDSRCVAVIRRIPPTLYGDGSSSVSELIHRKNAIRLMNPHLRTRLIKLDKHRISLLHARGIDEQYVPPFGEKIVLDPKGNFSTGADSEDITDIVHNDYKVMVESFSKSLAGSHIIGIDVLSKDHTKPASPESYIVVEANTGSGLLGHFYPMYGTRRNVFRMLAESCKDRLRRCGSAYQSPILALPQGEKDMTTQVLSQGDFEGAMAGLEVRRAAMYGVSNNGEHY